MRGNPQKCLLDGQTEFILWSSGRLQCQFINKVFPLSRRQCCLHFPSFEWIALSLTLQYNLFEYVSFLQPCKLFGNNNLHYKQSAHKLLNSELLKAFILMYCFVLFSNSMLIFVFMKTNGACLIWIVCLFRFTVVWWNWKKEEGLHAVAATSLFYTTFRPVWSSSGGPLSPFFVW